MWDLCHAGGLAAYLCLLSHQTRLVISISKLWMGDYWFRGNRSRGLQGTRCFWGPEKFDFRRIVETTTPAVLIKGIENGDLNYFAATACSAHAESRFSSQEPYVYDTDPKNAPVHMQQALRLENRGNLGEALVHLSVAIKLDSENPYLYRKRAQLRELIGLTKEAKKDLDTAEKLYMKKPMSFKDSGG